MFKIGYAKWPIIFAVAIASAIGINRPAALASDQGTNPVTFQVNMAVQIFEQKFDPAADFVYVRGSFNGWAAVDTLVDVNGDSVYSKVIALDDSLVGKTINFKFYYKHGSTDVWEGDPNRSYEVPAGQSEVPLDFFDRDNVYNPPLGEEKTANITFRVDMSDYISRGIFTAGDTLVVRGNFNGWSGYDDRLTPQFGKPTLYTLTKSMTNNVNAKVEYKYVMKLAGFADVWEAGGNREFLFTGTDMAFDPVVPKFTDPRPTTQELTRTFVVNAKPLYRKLAAVGYIVDIQSGDTLRDVQSVEIAGPDPPFNGWPWGNIPEQWRLWDDGTHGDETAGDSLFTNTFVFPVGSPREAEYKYGANTRDVEAGFARNHVLRLDDNVVQDVIRDVWGSPDTLYAAYTVSTDFPTEVMFQVNMAVQIFEQKFDPSADSVYVRGSFNGWGTADRLTDVDGDSIYSKSIMLPDSLVGTTLAFKFYYKHGSTDVWEGDPNRSYEVPAGQSEVPLDFFDRDNVYNPPLGEEKTANITFRVDMSDYISRGIFTASDTLVVRGNFNGWGGYDDRLTPQFGQPNLYTLTKALTTNVNAVLEYKFVMKLAGFPDVWESGGNRTFVFTGNDITLDSAVPKFADPRPTTQELTRTFVVNVRPLYRRLAAEGFILDIQSGDTIRTVKSIEIAGPDPPFNGWPWGNIPEQWRLWDDGSHGDETAGDSLFTNTFVFPAGSPREAEYKYGANTRDVEAGFAKNHILKLDDNVAQDEIFDVWGSPDTLYKAYTINEDFVVSVESRSKVIPKTFALSQNYPNPFNPGTTINFDLPQKQHVVIIVYNMMGQEITRLVDEEKQAGSFKVTWNGRDSFGRQMPSGLYIYKIKAGKFTKTLKMLMLK